MSNELIRKQYQPTQIRVLLVGESEPIGGDFFYKAKGSFYTNIKNTIWPFIKSSENFLDDFKNHGFYLDDLILRPVNHLAKNDRKVLAVEWAPDLAHRVKSYQPQLVVCLMKSIVNEVKSAVEQSGVNPVFL